MENNDKRKFSPLLIIGLLFFIFGFITWLNSVLVPFLKTACELTNFQSYFVTFAFYIAYFVLAPFASGIIGKLGYKRSMSVGLWIMSLGALVFLPAAAVRSYPLFLIGLFLLGGGLTLLQTAANPYAAVLGSPESAARRISIMGVCNKTAGMLAPLLLSSFTIKKAEQIQLQIAKTGDQPFLHVPLLDELARQCIVPYVFIVVSLFLLAVWIHYSALPEIAEEKAVVSERFSLRRYPALCGGMAAIFFYVGAEVISIDTLINYAFSLGYGSDQARWFPVLSMLMLLAGYFIGIWGVPKHFSQRQALSVSCAAGILLSGAALWTPGAVSLFLLAALGLANAMIWPSVWGLAVQGLGQHLHIGSSLLIMAIVGGAVLPLGYGFAADRIGLQAAYSILPVCYGIIGLYAWRNGEVRR
ncbi:MAG: glucose/galactose MFS transporter [Bacteroidales bacterium]|nr:glucose/galactose MFS transporter [Bacteroidales bacterium]